MQDVTPHYMERGWRLVLVATIHLEQPLVVLMEARNLYRIALIKQFIKGWAQLMEVKLAVYDMRKYFIATA